MLAFLIDFCRDILFNIILHFISSGSLDTAFLFYRYVYDYVYVNVNENINIWNGNHYLLDDNINGTKHQNNYTVLLFHCSSLKQTNNCMICKISHSRAHTHTLTSMPLNWNWNRTQNRFNFMAFWHSYRRLFTKHLRFCSSDSHTALVWDRMSCFAT